MDGDDVVIVKKIEEEVNGLIRETLERQLVLINNNVLGNVIFIYLLLSKIF